MLDKGSTVGRSILRSASDMGSRRSKKSLARVAELDISIPLKDSPSDVIVEPFTHSLSGRWSRIPEPNSSPLPDIHSDLKFNFDDVIESMKESNNRPSEENEEYHSLTSSARPIFQRSYTVNKRTTDLSKVPLPPSAALFYNGHSPYVEVVESCQSIHILNMYLRAKKHDVSAGAPGRFLHAVIGPDISGKFNPLLCHPITRNSIQALQFLITWGKLPTAKSRTHPYTYMYSDII